MIIFVVSALIYLALSPSRRHHLKNPKLYAAMVLAALIYLPNLYWNYTHDFVSFKHTEDNAHLEGPLFHPLKMLEFIGAQFGVFGPILFGWLLALLPRYRALCEASEAFKLLWWFIVPFFALITTISLLSRAHANWSAPMYVASVVLVTAWLLHQGRKGWLHAAIGVNVLLGVAFYHLHDLARVFNVTLTKKDPYKRVRGWRKLGEEVTAVMRRYPNAGLLSDDRKEMAELIYYVTPHPFGAVKWNPDHSKKDHYELTTDMRRHIGEDFILVTHRRYAPGYWRRYFASARKIEHIVIPLYKDYAMAFDVYYLKDFKGYR
jgi:uncharacterized membrane protein